MTPSPLSRDQVACTACDGSGRIIVSHEMAMDAGDRRMEGETFNCPTCGGDGWILEIANG